MESRNKDKARAIASLLNDFSFNAKEVAKEMTREHKTLQQNFTRLCVEWLKVCASDEYSFDGRNEASHEVAKVLLEGKDELPPLPFI